MSDNQNSKVADSDDNLSAETLNQNNSVSNNNEESDKIKAVRMPRLFWGDVIRYLKNS